jgi:hypothetical protein
VAATLLSLFIRNPVHPGFMGFKPLELELNSWYNLQYSRFKLQELHDLIFFMQPFIYVYIKRKTQGKKPNNAV